MTQPNHKDISVPKAENKKHSSEVHISSRKLSRRKNIFAFLMLSLLIGILIGAAIFYPAGKRYKLASSVSLKTYSPGQVINTSHFDIKISDISYDTKGKEPFRPDKNNKYMIFNLNIKNKTNTEMPVFPSNQTMIKDDQGKVYRMTVANLNHPFQAGHLPPGDKIQGQIAFELPNTLQHPVLFFDSGWPDSNVSIKL